MIKQAVIIGCLAVAGAAQAREQQLAQVAPSHYVDTEASTNVPFNFNLPSLKKVDFGVALVGTPSNNVEFVAGHDSDCDGKLSLDERALWLAWDCGEWFLGGKGYEGWGMSDLPIVTGGPDTNGVVWAHVEVDVRRHKSNPRWLYSDTWDLVQVTRRGVDDPQERVYIRTRVSGFMLKVR